MMSNDEGTACRRLWAAVLAQAIEDFYRGEKRDKDSAEAFISRSKDFYMVCDMAGVNADWIKRKIAESQDPTFIQERIRDFSYQRRRKARN